MKQRLILSLGLHSVIVTPKNKCRNMWFCDDASQIELWPWHAEDVCTRYIACSQHGWRFAREGNNSLLNVLWAQICTLAINRTRILFQLKGMSCWFVMIISWISTCPERVQKDCLLFAMSGAFVPFCSDASLRSFGMHLKSEHISCQTCKYWESNLELRECHIFLWKIGSYSIWSPKIPYNPQQNGSVTQRTIKPNLLHVENFFYLS